MKRTRTVTSIALVLVLTTLLAVGSMAIEALAAEETEPAETIEVSVADLLSGYEEGDADHVADTLRPVLATDTEDLVIAPAPQAKYYSAGQFDITVNGVTLDAQGCAMVPLRKVAEALGYTVTWNGDDTVTVDSGKMHTTVTFGEDLYFATTSIEGMVGMTAPFSLGVPPYCVNGITYVPLGLFEVLEGNEEGFFLVYDNDVVIDAQVYDELPIDDYRSPAEPVDVVIVSVEEDFTGGDLAALLEKYDMTVVYDYQSFSVYAFRLPKALAGQEMADFLDKLESEEKVLFAEPDSVIYLDDPVTDLY